MTNITKLLAPAAASFPGSGLDARPRPVTSDLGSVILAAPSGEFHTTALAGVGVPPTALLAYGTWQPATAVLDVPGSRTDQMSGGNPRLAGTTRNTHQQHRQWFRYWSPPN